jgi:hypothetical protein
LRARAMRSLKTLSIWKSANRDMGVSIWRMVGPRAVVALACGQGDWRLSPADESTRQLEKGARGGRGPPGSVG